MAEQNVMQRKLDAINRAGQELVRLEDDTSTNRSAAERLKLLEDRIIHCGRDILDYRNLAIMVVDERTNKLEFLVSQGFEDKISNYELFVAAEGSGICGCVAATGESCICNDVTKDPRYIIGLADARSSLTVPLRLHDKIVGVMNVESDRLDAFSEEDRQYAEIFANYVALALHILNLLASERRSTHTQVSDSYCVELSGPLGDIVTAATELKEDYIGLDDLRQRLDVLIDRATHARHAIRQLSQAPTSGVLGVAPEQVKKDPILAGKRILVADDEEIIRQTVSGVLEPYGCIMDVAADGSQAKRMVSSERYDLVISDIKMPHATGYDVFTAALAANSATKVILMTAFGYDPHHSVVRANQQGLSAVLLKPFKVKQLLDKCRSALCER